MSHARRRWPALLALALALLSAGCGLGSSDAEVLAEAGRRTEAAGTARVAVSSVVDGGVGQAQQRTVAEGRVSFPRRFSELEVEVSAALTSGSTGAGGMAMVVMGDDTRLVARSVGAPDEQGWTQIPMTEPDAEGIAPGPGGGAVDLAEQLELLSRGVTAWESLGADPVRNDPAEHHRATISLPTAIAATPPEQAALLEALAGRLRDEQFALDVWIGEGLVRRMSYAVALEPTPEQRTQGISDPTLSLTMEYFDFGVPFDTEMPVDVAAP